MSLLNLQWSTIEAIIASLFSRGAPEDIAVTDMILDRANLRRTGKAANSESAYRQELTTLIAHHLTRAGFTQDIDTNKPNVLLTDRKLILDIFTFLVQYTADNMPPKTALAAPSKPSSVTESEMPETAASVANSKNGRIVKTQSKSAPPPSTSSVTQRSSSAKTALSTTNAAPVEQQQQPPTSVAKAKARSFRPPKPSQLHSAPFSVSASPTLSPSSSPSSPLSSAADESKTKQQLLIELQTERQLRHDLERQLSSQQDLFQRFVHEHEHESDDIRRLIWLKYQFMQLQRTVAIQTTALNARDALVMDMQETIIRVRTQIRELLQQQQQQQQRQQVQVNDDDDNNVNQLLRSIDDMMKQLKVATDNAGARDRDASKAFNDVEHLLTTSIDVNEWDTIRTALAAARPRNTMSSAGSTTSSNKMSNKLSPNTVSQTSRRPEWKDG